MSFCYSKAGLSFKPKLDFFPTFVQKSFSCWVVPIAVILLDACPYDFYDFAFYCGVILDLHSRISHLIPLSTVTVVNTINE